MRIGKRSVARFWRYAKGHEDPLKCWLWQGSMGKNGYGRMQADAQRWAAHRLAWTIVRGHIPPGKCVLHKCDTPACVNPQHLYLGTPRDNGYDRIFKDRHPGFHMRTVWRHDLFEMPDAKE